MANFKELLQNVKAFAFDVDGVFTDGQVYLHSDGEMVRAMNIKDGYALQLAVKKQYPIAIITGGRSEMVKQRFKRLGITDIYLNSHSKIDDFNDFLFKYDLAPENIMYMGDDIPDYEVMQKVGLPVCPADAAEEIKNISLYISDKKGGNGCVRDVMEQVLRLHGKWMDTESFSW